mgnify:FL=1
MTVEYVKINDITNLLNIFCVNNNNCEAPTLS